MEPLSIIGALLGIAVKVAILVNVTISIRQKLQQLKSSTH